MSAAATAARRLQTFSQGRLVLAVILLVSAFVLFLPARQLLHQRSEMNRLEDRLTALSAENRRLSEQVARLQSPEELEALARQRLGLVKPGEDAYYFVDPPSAEPTPATARREERSVVSRAWSWLTELVRGSG